jgi:RNA polymerase sigma-70 factor (ECF subfamily)
MSSGDPLRHLVEAAQAGDDVALGELIRQTQTEVRRLCRALTSEHEADDAAQETYLRALGAISRFRGEAPVRTWLLSIARRVCADHVRTAQRRRRRDDRLRAQTVGSAEPGPAFVDDLLSATDPDRREAFVLTQVIGLPYEEAAAIVGCPVGTIRSRVARARIDLERAATPQGSLNERTA